MIFDRLIESAILIIWIIIGVWRYLVWEDENGRGVEPEITCYKWHTIVVNGPWWWFLWTIQKSCEIGSILNEKLKVNNWFNELFKIEKKDNT